MAHRESLRSRRHDDQHGPTADNDDEHIPAADTHRGRRITSRLLFSGVPRRSPAMKAPLETPVAHPAGSMHNGSVLAD
jgi:hypothetical protein